jgi:hypothetical protein
MRLFNASVAFLALGTSVTVAAPLGDSVSQVTPYFSIHPKAKQEIRARPANLLPLSSIGMPLTRQNEARILPPSSIGMLLIRRSEARILPPSSIGMPPTRLK